MSFIIVTWKAAVKAEKTVALTALRSDNEKVDSSAAIGNYNNKSSQVVTCKEGGCEGFDEGCILG